MFEVTLHRRRMPPSLPALVLVLPMVRGLTLGKLFMPKAPRSAGSNATEECLAARRSDPTLVCTNATAGDNLGSAGGGRGTFTSTFEGPLTPVNYPHWLDVACNSEGGFLCDPAKDEHTSMTPAQRVNVSKRLSKLRQRDDSLVVCGRLQGDPVDVWHYQPFYLGVAVLPGWPAVSTDPVTLQAMGEMIMADWHMDSRYVGIPQPLLRCPTTGMLFILPHTGEVFLSTPSCEFLCDSNGGEEVVAKARAALRAGGGKNTYAAAMQGSEAVYQHLAALRAEGTKAAVGHSAREKAAEEWNASNLLQRVVFGLAVLSLVAALFFGLFVIVLGPGLAARRVKFEH